MERVQELSQDLSQHSVLSLGICWERDRFCGSKNSFLFWSDLLCICYLILNLWMHFSPGFLTRPTCVLDKDYVWVKCKDSPSGGSPGHRNQPVFLVVIAITGVTSLVRHTLFNSFFFPVFHYIRWNCREGCLRDVRWKSSPAWQITGAEQDQKEACTKQLLFLRSMW